MYNKNITKKICFSIQIDYLASIMTTERQPKVIEETISMLELLQTQIEHGGNVTITKYSSEHHHMQYLIKQLKTQLYASAAKR